jgi:superfamily II DNA or RNA helicase
MLDLRAHQNNALNSLSAAVRGIINLPTGTGKTLIQSRKIVNEITASVGTKVYVVLSPRILLSNQLMGDVKEDLVAN